MKSILSRGGLAVLLFSFALVTLADTASGPRERTSFNAGWRFARFGPMPDGSFLPEPGQPAKAVTASSEEAGKGNTAGMATDGDSNTRWCAADGSMNQWLAVDLGKITPLGALEIEWEYNLAYQYKVEVSSDGKSWKTAVDRTQNNEAARIDKAALDSPGRFVRITITSVPENKWASIYELRVFDPAGKPLQPVAPYDGAAASPKDAAFNDSDWRQLNLPHDWGIEGPFKQEFPGETGKLPWWGIGWYRKHFEVPAAEQGKNFYLDVDGAMSHAQVWLNGQLVGGWPYGYASWRVDLTPFVKFGADNVVAIRLDNPPDSSRWYPGGGIYRNVWLVKTAPVHVAHWGTYVTTPEISARAATVKIQVNMENETAAESVVTVKNEIFELGTDNVKGKSVASLATEGVKVAAHQSQSSEGRIVLPDPKLWSLEKPQRYVAVTSLEQNGRLVDSYETPFGIRTIQFTADHGFLLNGKRVPLNGVCNHHDLGALGTAINVRALERQIQILKEMGGNAIRTSHNPPAPELLDLCDRLGMLVMDESFDCWMRGKTRNDYQRLWDDWHEKDWRAELRRDRNHPCIILWSIGNEVGEQDSPAGLEIAAELTRIAHEEDPTRPTTSACSDARAAFNGFQQHVDVFGYNYKPTLYGRAHETNSSLPIFGSETASCVSSRGEYFFPVSTDKSGGKADFQMSSYDLYAPPWATPPDWEFKGEDQFPFVAGEFVWTGFDYLGEPTPYNGDLSNLLNFTDPAERARMQKELDALGRIQVPSRSSYFGIIDLAGFPKDRYYLYQARWRPDFPMAHILPHWNWPDRLGQVTPVHVYTSGDAAELFLNGQSLGLKKKGPYEYRLRWDNVVYQPGELKVVAYKDGKKWATDVMRTTGPGAKLKLQADRDTIRADGQDLSFVTVTIADQDGLLVPRSKNRVHFDINGPGEIVATDNGDATSFESFQSHERNAFNGLCLVIVRSKPGESGKVTLRATSGGLAAAEIPITTTPAQ
ncbi:MAG: beta-galactosidase GalB [Verrucomicrobiia bacterium]